jgi:TrmH family RNA methyltransferase
MPLSSLQNPLLQKLRRAAGTGHPLADGGIVAEGPHLLQEALRSAWTVQYILCAEDRRERHQALLSAAEARGIEITGVSGRAFKSLSGTEQDQGILFVVRPRAFGWADLFKSPGPLVILDGLQDPGNAGAIVRSAEAFGAAGVAFSQGCVRISNGKLLRAAAGSIFRLPYVEDQPREAIISQVRSAQRRLFSLEAGGSQSLFTASLSGPFALVVGSEGAGVSAILRDAGQGLSIPTEKVESLNAAIACSVALFEAARQNQLKRMNL